MAGSGTAEDPYQITNATELQAMNEDREAHYALANDIDASETSDWNRGDGFDPIGSYEEGDGFRGTLDGQNHTITGLKIDRQSTAAVGLFAVLNGGTVEHLTLKDVSITGEQVVGGSVGSARNSATIDDVSVSGTINAESGYAGGVVGTVSESTVVGAHSSADVSAKQHAGGLAGVVSGGTVQLSTATGDVAVTDIVAGGAFGEVLKESSINRVYARGSVTGSSGIGGLIGTNYQNEISNAYATGEVTGDNEFGALLGVDQKGGTTSNLYWNEQTAGVSNSVGSGSDVGTAVSTDEMQGASSKTALSGLKFDQVWATTDSYPVLRDEIESVSLRAPDQLIVSHTGETSVRVTLADGRTVTATETASYDSNQSFLSVDGGVLDASGTGMVEVTASVGGHPDSNTVSVVTPPDISVESRSLRYDSVGSETAAPVDVTLTNDGGADGEFDVVLSINGTTEQTRTVTVPGHSTTTVQLNYSAPATGTYPVAVNGTDLGDLTVVEEPETSVASASVSKRLLAVGNGTTVEATVENAGDAAAGQTVELTAGGETVATKDVVVPADGTTVSFDYTADSTGEYDLSVGGTSAGTLTVAEMGSVSVESVSVPESVEAGASYEVTVTLANSGGLPLNSEVAYNVGGTSVGTQTAEVPADGTTVTFEATAPEGSESIDHAVTTGDAEWTGSSTVAIETATAESSGDGSDGGSTGDGDGASNDGDSAATTSGDGPGFGVGAALVALLALVAATRYRRRCGESGDSMTQIQMKRTGFGGNG
ncbi:CARDB domain-containing protein [Halosimplex aquaticum]